MSENTNNDQHAQLFMSLVTSMHVGAMYQLGKVASPISGKIERDLQQAKYTIDLLGMLEVKTKGNLSDDEDKFLGRILSELRMNYIDESQKTDPEQEASAEAQPESDSKSEGESPAAQGDSDPADKN